MKTTPAISTIFILILILAVMPIASAQTIRNEAKVEGYHLPLHVGTAIMSAHQGINLVKFLFPGVDDRFGLTIGQFADGTFLIRPDANTLLPASRNLRVQGSMATGGISGGDVYVVGGSGAAGNGDVVLGHDGTSGIGNVGIGTNAPAYKLDVAGDSRVSGDSMVAGNIHAVGYVQVGQIPAGTPSSAGRLALNGETLQVSVWDPIEDKYVWTNLASGAVAGGASGEWWLGGPNTICYGDNITNNGAEPICVHAGGSQLIASNAYWTGSEWRFFDAETASAIVTDHNGIGFLSKPQVAAGSPVGDWNVGFRATPQGGLLISDSVAAGAPAGTLRMLGSTLQVYDGLNWSPINNDLPDFQPWLNCGSEGICFQGDTSGAVSNFIYTNSVSDSMFGSTYTPQYDALKEGVRLNDYIYTNNDQIDQAVYGLDDITLSAGYRISSVDVIASCRISQPTYTGSIKLGLNNAGSQTVYSSDMPITSSTYSQFSHSFQTNPWTGQPWTETDIKNTGVSIYMKGGSKMQCGSEATAAETSLEGSSRILMGDNTYKQIKDVVVGDVVVSFDTETEQFVSREVLRTVVGKKSIITINGELSLSLDHKVYVYGFGYKEAKDLVVGDYLVSESGVKELVREIVAESDEIVPVYDFTVDYPNNFFADGYLVHNDYNNCTFTYARAECRVLKADVVTVPEEYKIEISSFGNTKFSGNVLLRNLSVAHSVSATKDVAAENVVASQNLKATSIDASEISGDSLDIAVIRSQSYLHESGQKTCLVMGATGWRDLTNMPFNADWQDCSNLAGAIGGAGATYRMGCLFDSGDVSFGNTLTQGPVPNVGDYPVTNCGWFEETGLVYNVHSEDDCNSISGGSVFTTPQGVKICRIVASSCPGGWTQYGQWTATSSVAYNGGFVTCEESPQVLCCPAACLSGSHAFSNHFREACIYGTALEQCTTGYSAITEVGCY